MHKGNWERVCSGACQVETGSGNPTDLGNLTKQNSSFSVILDHLTRRGLNVMLVARDKKALENLAEEIRAEGVQAKVVVEDFAKEGAVSRVVDKVPISSLHARDIFTHRSCTL